MTSQKRESLLVRDTGPSRTAQAVAAERALLTDMGALADPLARTMLTPTMAAFSNAAKHIPPWLRARSVTLAGLAARVLWFDAQVADALDSHIAQIVIIGAGYDSRAWRFCREHVQFFELDQASTQSDKALRAPGPGPTYVAADLRIDTAAKALFDHGLDPSAMALFVMEGVTMYLEEKVVRHQLCELAKVGAPGSRLAVDFHPPRDAGTALNHRQNRLQRLARSGSGETFKLTLKRAEAVGLVTQSGWDVTEETSIREAALSLVPGQSGLRVDAVNEHKTLVAGSVMVHNRTGAFE